MIGSVGGTVAWGVVVQVSVGKLAGSVPVVLVAP